MINLDDADVASATGAKVGAGITGAIALRTALKEGRKGYHGLGSTGREAAAAASKAAHIPGRSRLARAAFRRSSVYKGAASAGSAAGKAGTSILRKVVRVI